MGFNCGIVGLPNVGKSTIFNALTSAGAQASNYPFTTIDPNVGVVDMPDERLGKLADIYEPKKLTPTSMEFVDIAGLVKGASQGEGLGNKFLANIREVDAIAHVVRCFEDPNVIHVANKVDPKADIEVIEAELMLADLDAIEKRLHKAEKLVKTADKKTVDLRTSTTQHRRVIYNGSWSSSVTSSRCRNSRCGSRKRRCSAASKI